MDKNKVVPLARYEAGYPSEYNPTPPPAGSADAEIYSAGGQLRNWARYLAKNSSIIKATLDARCTKGIGPGLKYEPMVRDSKGKLLTELNAAISKVHMDWSESADVTGELSREKIENIAWREWDTVGEIFGRRVHRGRTVKTLGYQVQLIRSELVPYGFMDGDKGATMGVDRDEWGKPTRYFVYPYSPESSVWRYSLPSANPVPIPANQIKHLRRQEETDATRGVTLFHAVIFRASDVAEYQQSHRRAARASANLFASINRDMDYQSDDENSPEGIDAATGQRELNLLDLQLIDFLKAGESVNFHKAEHPNVNAVEFVNQELRQFAASCRVAFSWIAYVFDRAFAAQRTELNHAWEMITQDRADFIRDFAKPLLYSEPLRVAILEGRLPAAELRKADQATLYDVRIDGPNMPSLDPKSDRAAAKIDQEMGWESRHGNIRRFNRNPVQVDAERAQDDFKPVSQETTSESKITVDKEDVDKND